MSLGIPTNAHHSHPAADITSGTLDDARIAASSVLQHQSSIDHGALAGLGDDDHVQYAKADGSRWTTTQTASRAIISDGSGHLVVSDVTAAELGYLAGVTSSVQTQLDGKADSGHTHALESLTNVSITSPADGQVLKYSGGSWVNGSLPSSAISFGDIATDTSVGMQIGTAINQLLGFWATAPVVQPTSADQVAVTLANSAGDFSSLNFSDPPTRDEVIVLRNQAETLAGDVRNLSTLVHAIRTALVSCGLIKGS
jgi:hypothetical protein